MKTIFTVDGMMLRIAIDDCGRAKATQKEIEAAIKEGKAEVRGHCLCRKLDGKVLAEITGGLSDTEWDLIEKDFTDRSKPLDRW